MSCFVEWSETIPADSQRIQAFGCGASRALHPENLAASAFEPSPLPASPGWLPLFKAADLSFVANVATGGSTDPVEACSDGINFWITDRTRNLLRF